MGKRTIAILAIAMTIMAAVSARSLELFDIPYADGSILWPEVGRDCFEQERGEFELDGPDERWFEISLEGKEKHHHFGSRKSYLERELKDKLKEESRDAREEGAELETDVSFSDDRHYHLTVEIADRFGVYWKSFIGLFLDNGAYLEFESEYLDDDAFAVEKIEESLLSLH